MCLIRSLIHPHLFLFPTWSKMSAKFRLGLSSGYNKHTVTDKEGVRGGGAAKTKNTVQALEYPSADAVTQTVHKSDATAANALCH